MLRVVYLVFTEGHKPSAGDALVRGDLCDQAIRLARALAALLPGEPEVTGLLALLLLTDARRGARVSPAGDLVLLAEQDRVRWNQAKIAEGEALLEQALRAPPARAVPAAGRDRRLPFRAAVAPRTPTGGRSPRSTASCSATSRRRWWRRTGRSRWPWPRARRPGLVMLDEVSADRRLARWPQLHIARAELLGRLGRRADAVAAYQAALELAPAAPERAFIGRRIGELAEASAASATTTAVHVMTETTA